jgi:hypothetical protein
MMVSMSSRADFWAVKLGKASSLGINIDDLLNAIVAESVSREIIEGRQIVKFQDGSILRVTPTETPNGLMGLVETNTPPSK